jgi:type VI secretion system secreted protein Hcp
MHTAWLTALWFENKIYLKMAPTQKGGSEHMAYDAFLKIHGIEGESTDSRHPGWIEILNYDLDIRQTVSRTAGSAGGAGAVRADFSVFGFTKLLDKASPKLALACAAGTHIDTITLELCRAGGDKVRFMQYTFSNCMLSCFATSADSGFPEDDVAFNYGKIQWCYTQQKRAGGWAAGNVAAAWSLEKNCRA